MPRFLYRVPLVFENKISHSSQCFLLPFSLKVVLRHRKRLFSSIRHPSTESSHGLRSRGRRSGLSIAPPIRHELGEEIRIGIMIPSSYGDKADLGNLNADCNDTNSTEQVI